MEFVNRRLEKITYLSFVTCTLHQKFINEDEIGGASRTHGINHSYKILVGKPEGKR
jgi:hypothetical protein